MIYVCYDNFMWHPDIPVTSSSERKGCPLINLYDPDPTVIYQIDNTTVHITLDCHLTGNRKPFATGLYNHNLPVGATFKMLGDTANDFAPAAVTSTYTIEEDIYDRNNIGRAANKFLILHPDILAASILDKSWIRILIEGANNPIKFGILFVGSIIELNMRTATGTVPNFDMDTYKQLLNDPSTEFKSLDGQAHVRVRKINHVLKWAVTNAGLHTRNAVRRLIKRVGVHKLVFINLGDTDTANTEKEYLTQVYYGYFSNLPSLDELEYYDAMEELDIEGNSNISFDMEFTEIV